MALRLFCDRKSHPSRWHFRDLTLFSQFKDCKVYQYDGIPVRFVLLYCPKKDNLILTILPQGSNSAVASHQNPPRGKESQSVQVTSRARNYYSRQRFERQFLWPDLCLQRSTLERTCSSFQETASRKLWFPIFVIVVVGILCRADFVTKWWPRVQKAKFVEHWQRCFLFRWSPMVPSQ